jgi:hypothetical protein
MMGLSYIKYQKQVKKRKICRNNLMIFYSLISQNAPVLQCLQGGKISPATICILFSFSVG